MGDRAHRIVFADALRGVAALSVVAAHYGLFFWDGGQQVAEVANIPPVPAGVMPPLTARGLAAFRWFNLGQFGVALFFLVSGFVIPLSLDRLTSGAFARSRIWRIVPTYAAGFLVTVLALAAGSALYGRPFPYSAGAVAIHFVPGLRALLVTPHIDYVVWTLEVEVAFYILAAAMAPWLRRGSLLVFVPPAAILLVALAVPNPYRQHAISLQFLFAGVALSYWCSRKTSLSNALMVGGTAVASSLAALFWLYPQAIGSATACVAAAAVFLACCLGRMRPPGLALVRAIAQISYPLYVVHGIMGYVAMRLMLDRGMSPGAAVIGAFVLALAVAAVLHVTVELPTQAIGRRPLGLWRLPAGAPHRTSQAAGLLD